MSEPKIPPLLELIRRCEYALDPNFNMNQKGVFRVVLAYLRRQQAAPNDPAGNGERRGPAAMTQPRVRKPKAISISRKKLRFEGYMGRLYVAFGGDLSRIRSPKDALHLANWLDRASAWLKQWAQDQE